MILDVNGKLISTKPHIVQKRLLLGLAGLKWL